MNNPPNHSMRRRSLGNNYKNPGLYHITITVHDRKTQSLGRIVGDFQCPDNHPNAPRVELTAIGKMVEHELLHSISAHYPIIEIQDYVIMPDYIHFIINVKNSLISKNGRETHHLLLLSPWTYQYCPANENITIAQCKTMNCITQAICKLKDN